MGLVVLCSPGEHIKIEVVDLTGLLIALRIKKIQKEGSGILSTSELNTNLCRISITCIVLHLTLAFQFTYIPFIGNVCGLLSKQGADIS